MHQLFGLQWFHHFYFVLVLVIAQMPSVYINLKTSIYIYIEKKQTLLCIFKCLCPLALYLDQGCVMSPFWQSSNSFFFGKKNYCVFLD